MKSVDLIKLRDAAEAAGTDGRALGRYSRAMACAISALEAAEAENAELRARVAELEGMVLKWVSVLRALDEDETRAAAAMAKGEV
jgi:hypothetical protein